MKRNFGSAIVKKSISIAMACMLILATPIANVQASNVSNEQLESIVDHMNDEEKELAGNIYNDLQTKVDGEHGPQKAIDDVYAVGEDNLTNAAEGASNKAENAAAEAKESAENAEEAKKNADEYMNKLEEVIYDDKNYMGEDGAYCIKYLPENKDNDVNDPYTNCADIQVNIKDENGNVTQESLVEYTDAMAKEANDAAKKATEIANNVTADTDIEKAAAQLDAAKEAAQTALDNAEKARDAAILSLDAEILVYNSLIAAYYPENEAKALFKTNSKGETPHDSEIAKNLMSKADMDDSFKNNFEAQAKVIADAKILVKDCEYFVNTTAREAVKLVEEADKNFVINLYGVIEQCQLALDGCNQLDPESEDYATLQKQLLEARDIAAKFFGDMKNDADRYLEENPDSLQKGYAEALSNFVGETQKHLVDFSPEDDELKTKLTNFFETINTGADAILNWYTKEDPTHPDDMYPQESVHYAINTANKLIENLVGEADKEYDGILGIADEKIDTAYANYQSYVKRYESAKEAYDKANIIERFTTLKAKLDAAEADLIQAKANYDAALKDKETIEDAKKSFDEEVKKVTESGETGNTTPSTNTTPSSSTTPTSQDTGASTPNTATISDEPTALSDTPILAISDKGDVLDQVPKTGDKLPASMPFAAASLVAFMGAALINLKRRITR